jgi:hypothetical protein
VDRALESLSAQFAARRQGFIFDSFIVGAQWESDKDSKPKNL